MSDKEDMEREWLVKQLVKQYMKDQLENIQDHKKGRNNSFIFLEDQTLNMLFIYMLMNLDRPSNQGGGDHQAETHIPDEVVEEINRAITQNKEEFEEIIALLKAKV